ncbi:MAG: diol dehydratase small subunit [Syntrophothermus sp.]
MIAKSTLIQLIKEVLAENPGLLADSRPVHAGAGEVVVPEATLARPGGGKAVVEPNRPAGTFAPLVQLATLAENRGQLEVARYLHLAVEAESLTPAVQEKLRDILEPYRYTRGELEELASELEERWQAPYHADYVREILACFARNHCLRREPAF